MGACQFSLGVLFQSGHMLRHSFFPFYVRHPRSSPLHNRSGYVRSNGPISRQYPLVVADVPDNDRRRLSMEITMRIFRHPPESRSRELLAECNLPASDLESYHFDHFLGCGAAEDLKGIVGLEIFGSIALLRSLAVADEARDSGCGKTLVTGAEDYAKEKGVRELYLLTITAEHFFAPLGYSCIERSTAPGQIEQTTEFSGLCPNSATFMMKKFTG